MERLQKVIANAGVASRRKAETLIATGHVTLNGEVVKEMGIKVDSTSDHIEVDGVPLTRERKVYYVLYKPRQVISAVTDDKKRRVVTEYLGDIVERVYPIGRLDYDTSGLLLLTNDGDFANMMMHPKYKVDKTYIAKVSGLPTADMLRQLRKGIVLEKRKTAPAKVKVISTDRRKNTAIVSITIHEGMNHQVKNMLAAVGLSRSFLIHLYFLRKGISILTMQRAVAQRGEVTTLESHSWQESNPGLSDSNAQAPGL